MKKHRIERAIVLGLILSTSIYGTSFAQEINETVIEQGQIKNNNEEAVTINGGKESAIEPDDNISITTNNGNDITLNSDKYGIHINDGYDVILSSGGNNIINIQQQANLDNEKGHQDGIKIENNTTSNISFTAGEKNIIKATNNGIYVGSGNSSNVTFIADGNADGNNEFITGNNGIDHRGAGTVNITSTNGANIIRAGIEQNTVLGSTNDAGYNINTIDEEQLIDRKDGDGIRTEGSNGIVNMTAGTYNDIVARDSGLFINSKSENSTIELIAKGSNGTYGNIIYAQQSGVENDGNTSNNKINVTAENAGNYIMAEKVAKRDGDGMFAAVYNKGNGNIKVEAKKDNVLIAVAAEDITNNENEINGVASDGTGKVDVISDEGNNVIFGTQNGILSNETGEINVTATQGNNIIGRYTDENETTHISEKGIQVSKGTVNVTAGNDTKIYATSIGLNVDGDGYKGDSKININTTGDIVIDTGILENNDTSSTAINVSTGDVILNADGDIRINTNEVGDKYGQASGIRIDYYNDNGYGDDEKAGYVDINTKGNLIIGSDSDNNIASSGIFVDTYAGTVDVNTEKGIYVNIKGDTLIGVNESGHINVNANEDIVLNAESNNSDIVMGYIENRNNQYVTQGAEKELIGINGIRKSDVNIEAIGNIVLTANETNRNNFMNVGIFATGTRGNVNGKDVVTDGGNTDNVSFIDEYGYVMSQENTTNLKGNRVDVFINNEYGIANGILAQHSDKVNINLESTEGVNLTARSTNGHSIGIDTADGNVSLKSSEGSNMVRAVTDNENGQGIGIQTESEADYINYVYHNRVDLEAKQNNTVFGTTTGSYAEGADSIVSLTAHEGINIVRAPKGMAIDANDKSKTILTAEKANNIVSAGTVDEEGFGDDTAISALTASTVNLDAGNSNALAGTLYARDSGTTVNLTARNGDNAIQSSEHRMQEENGQTQHFVTALYAKDNANVTLTAGDGGSNYIASEAGKLGDNELERTVWAHKGADININGTTVISASNADINTASASGIGNSKGVAITAGTGVGVGEGDLTEFNMKDELRSQVNINGDAYITGDIASAYGGFVNINTDGNGNNYAHRTVLEGNALAGNGGKLNLNLGDGGVWYGRADDYGDASVMGENGHQEFFAPAFSSAISEGGQVNLTMGDNSTWFVEGQSWITNIDTSNAKNAMINLVDSNTDRNTTAHALTVYNLNGDATFEMNLNGNRDVSDMLYIKKANGNYDISLAEAVTTEDMYANGLNGLRFATVGSGSNVNFRAGTYDRGFFNVEYEVGSDSYNNNHENAVYNGTELNAEKPGNDTVDNFFESTLKPGESQQTKPEEEQPTTRMAKAANNEIATLAETAEAQPAAETASSGNVNETTNFKLIARKSENMSDAGKTILNMSRANYNQAVYMDTLNKRMGEARYLDEDQEGLWVRMRHDKTDKDTGFEISTNMYELGYDKKYESKDGNGYHRRGVAIDYMDGDTSYDDIAGSGETNRKGIWVYDTWFGNKGHYTDYIAKWGHLENSFDLYTKTRGEKVSGEYDNDVYSISAEWGYKNILNEDKENPENNKDKWYIEPQLQMQYARVTGADYTTSQGTDVFVDGIDSLIARAGFRLGKDFGDDRKSTFYVKADVLHEFLGDQDITVKDKTTDGIARTIGYDNDGTWYTVGLGFSTMLSDHSYAFLDVEKVFGNDNDNSYQINGGVQWAL